MHEDLEEEKVQAKALAEHEAQQNKHTLLELQRARDPARERICSRFEPQPEFDSGGTK